MEELSMPVLVDSLNETMKVFYSEEAVMGRCPNNFIDIPDRIISRNQCVIKFEDNKWYLHDTSSQKSTMLNNVGLKGGRAVLNSGDKITFSCSLSEFLFYLSLHDVPSIYKKRRTNDDENSPPLKMIKTMSGSECAMEVDSDVSMCEEGKKGRRETNPFPYQKLLEERAKTLREQCEKTLLQMEKLRKEKDDEIQKKDESLAEMRQDLAMKVGDILSLEKQKDILLKRLSDEEKTKETMILEIQSLTECLKDCEEEKERLAEERALADEKIKLLSIKAEKTDQDDSDSNEKPDEAALSSSALGKLVDLVESKWVEAELDQKTSELQALKDQITDMTLQKERHTQDVLELIDKELLCTICSEVLCDAVSLNCMHTFCKTCLVSWKEKKKECPVCRTRIKTETHPLLVDSFIDRLCDLIGGDLKTRRKEVKDERQQNPPPHGHEEHRRRNRRVSQPPTPRRRRTNARVYPANPFIPSVIIDLAEFEHGLMMGPAQALHNVRMHSELIDLTGDSPAAAIRRSTRNNNNH